MDFCPGRSCSPRTTLCSLGTGSQEPHRTAQPPLGEETSSPASRGEPGLAALRAGEEETAWPVTFPRGSPAWSTWSVSTDTAWPSSVGSDPFSGGGCSLHALHPSSQHRHREGQGQQGSPGLEEPLLPPENTPLPGVPAPHLVSGSESQLHSARTRTGDRQ